MMLAFIPAAPPMLYKQSAATAMNRRAAPGPANRSLSTIFLIVL
jgi:hypothetical protein